MTAPQPRMLDPKLDLMVERVVRVSCERAWAAWTEPDHLRRWYAPAPGVISECEIDLRPGGVFRTLMQSPEGQNMPASVGTYLVVEHEKRLVWTNALGPGFRPNPAPESSSGGFAFVADLRLDALRDGRTRYHARVMHATEAARDAHVAMGFEPGWNAALDQLVELMKAAG